MTNPTMKAVYRAPTVIAEAEVSLDEFDLDEIADYLKHHRAGLREVRENADTVERLYYETRGDGAIVGRTADDIRALLRELAGRA